MCDLLMSRMSLNLGHVGSKTVSFVSKTFDRLLRAHFWPDSQKGLSECLPRSNLGGVLKWVTLDQKVKTLSDHAVAVVC